MKQNVQRVALVITLLGAMLIYGCATIFKGTSQDVTINSSPSQAHVSIKRILGSVEDFAGTTPAKTRLSKKEEYVVTVSVAGYKDATVTINHSLEGWFFGNLLCGGVLGGIIDYADGAMWDLEPSDIMITLSTASIEGHDTRIYAMFRTLDDEGQLRSLAVPLIRESTNAVAAKRRLLQFFY